VCDWTVTVVLLCFPTHSIVRNYSAYGIILWCHQPLFRQLFCVIPESNFLKYRVASESLGDLLVQFTGMATVNKEMYVDILRYLRDPVRRKCLEKWRTNCWFLLDNNAPAHWLVLVRDFLSKNNITTLEHSLYLADLAPADFCLFSRLKSVLKGWCFVCYWHH